MSRDIGAVDAVHSVLPEAAALPFGLLTQFGDVWFLFAVAIACYWFRPADRDLVAVAIGIGITTAAVVEALKGLFGVPRPGTPLATTDGYPTVLHGIVEATATAGGHGFPSGHATLSTAMLLALAGAVRIGSPRRRAGLAIGLIGVISLTRVALGVHFLVDVVVGVMLGLAVLTGVAVAVRSSPATPPTTAFGLAVAVGVAGVALTTLPLDSAASGRFHVAHHPFLALVVALGAFAGWQAHEYRQRAVAERSAWRGLAAIGGAGAVLVIGSAGVLASDATFALAGAAGLGVATIIALPGIVPGFDDALEGYVPRRLHGLGDIDE
ncbi:hypothetical protein GCM10028857_24930 [Salinarchaeum chitinilyticum]